MNTKDKVIIILSTLFVIGLVVIGQVAHANKPWHPGRYLNDNMTVERMIDTTQVEDRNFKELQEAQERLLKELSNKKGK